MRRAAGLAAAALLAVAGCADKTPQATDAQVARARYVSEAPPALTLVTSIRKATGGGVHSALIINGPERAVFNPSGTWRHPQAPEQGDLHVGFSPAMEEWFFDYHARETFDIHAQTLEVPPEVAEQALALARARGSVWPAHDSDSDGDPIEVVGFNAPSAGGTFAPSFDGSFTYTPAAGFTGVETVVYRDDSPDDWSDLDLAFND